MSRKKHYTIPFFIPLKGCPFKCIFCDQEKITGEAMPSPKDVPAKIEKYLATMPGDAHVEVGFFGGSFTGLPEKTIKEFLSPVQPFVEDGRIRGIRLSTRPDLIDQDIVAFLKEYNVICIELGVQSMSDKVLLASRRGHTPLDVQEASRIITGCGLVLGHQMMLGLPGSTFRDEMYTAEKIKEMGAAQVRIYPALVIKGTELAGMWERGEYAPLVLDEAVRRAGNLIKYFEANNIKVIRCGLHPSEGLLTGEEYLAGPFHTAFGQKARAYAYTL
jgi:histone acetyltransferase (RNA polymerase elongator complex component)